MRLKLCPICVLISGTWLVLTFGVMIGVLGAAAATLPIAILMGGTVVGIAYQGEKAGKWTRSHPFWFKGFVLAAGFPAVYLAVTNLRPAVFIIELSLMVLLGLFLFRDRTSQSPIVSGDVSKLEEKLKKCC